MPRRLIVCADGTWNSLDNRDQGKHAPTNVVKIARSILPEDKKHVAQVVHYESGVGTDLGTRFVGGAFGAGLFDNVRSCYRFLMHNFMPGDELFFFGFSRGAYTVRSLAGMIRNCGILKRGHERLEEAAVNRYRAYDPESAPDAPESRAFRKANSFETDIHFIGVWDTVGALGIPGFDSTFRLARGADWQFHDVALSHSVHHAYHALSIHEHRAEFVPTLWERQKPIAGAKQKLEQVWFSGAHSDVGGGYEVAGLSDVALEWMVEKAAEAGLETDLAPLRIFDPKYRPDPFANGHDAFSALYKILGILRGRPQGIFRECDEACGRTFQSIHPSVTGRFLKEKDPKKWPPSFYKVLSRRVKNGG